MDGVILSQPSENGDERKVVGCPPRDDAPAEIRNRMRQ
jgi:hypothetical protein